jgi:hypothetical protein
MEDGIPDPETGVADENLIVTQSFRDTLDPEGLSLVDMFGTVQTFERSAAFGTSIFDKSIGEKLDVMVTLGDETQGRSVPITGILVGVEPDKIHVLMTFH